MKTTGLFAAALASLLAAYSVEAQQNDHPELYVVVDCMDATNSDYVAVETELWLPVHQALVDAGKRNSWALYEVTFGDRTVCDYYTVTTYLNEDQLNADPDFATVFNEVHSRFDSRGAMARTEASRNRVSTELWRVIDATEIGDHRYATVNRMRADDPLTYEQTESRVFKAAHQVLIDQGHRAGWAVYELVSPIGTAIPWNYATVDLMNEIGPVPMAEAILTANPDKDLEELYELLGVREQVHSETWMRIATTTAPSGD